MRSREQAASQALAPIQEILASAVSHAAITGSLEVLEERLVRALELINRLLEDTAIWTEDFDGDTHTMDVVCWSHTVFSFDLLVQSSSFCTEHTANIVTSTDNPILIHVFILFNLFLTSPNSGVIPTAHISVRTN